MSWLNDLSKNERIFVFATVVVGLLLIMLFALDSNWKKNYEEQQQSLNDQYQLDESKGE